MDLRAAHLTRRVRLAAAGLTACAALIVPATASASTATLSGGALSYTAAPGEANSVLLTYSFGGYQVQDNGAMIQSGGGCTISKNGHLASCPSGLILAVSVDLGDGNDALSTGLVIPVTIHGGAGDDTLAGGMGNDLIYGDGGNDSLEGSYGDDTLDGGAGADTISGSSGVDTVSYASRTAPVAVSLDGVAGDGEANEGDNVAASVENIVGGAGDDTLTGNASANTLDGGAGHDSFYGGAGADKILALDGTADTVACGADADTVANDPIDSIDADCEVRDAVAAAVGSGTGGGDTGGSGSGSGDSGLPGADVLSTLAPSLPIQRPTATSGGDVPLRVHCPKLAVGGCAGTIALTTASGAQPAGKLVAARRRKVVSVGSKRFKLAAGATKPVGVRLSRRGVRQLRLRHRLVVKATVAVRAEGGHTVSNTRTIVIRERRTASRRVTRRARQR